MIKIFKTDRINNLNVTLRKVAIFLAVLICFYIVNRIKPELMECDFKSYTLIGQIAIVIVLEFIFKLFQNIFRKRINEISIDTDQHMLTINYYSVMEGNIQRKLLFENIDSIIAAQIERAVVETINNFEPRVSVSEITAIPDPDNNRYKLQLEFFVINQTTPITINFFLERIR